MEKLVYRIKDRDGVHARPAGAILKAISDYKSTITLIYKDHQINLKNGIFVFLCLGIRFDDEIYLHIQGEDEEECAIGVRRAFEENL